MNLRYKLTVIKTYLKMVENWYTLFLDRFGLINTHYIIKMRNGLRLKVKGGSLQRGALVEIFSHDYFSGEVVVNDEDIVVDLGGNAGFFAISVAHKARQVYIVEPISTNYEIILENIRLNGYDKKIKAFKLAITDREGTAIFDLTENTPVTSLVITPQEEIIGQEAVRMTALTTFMSENNIERIDFLKVDIEGSEYDIVFNTDNTIFEVIDKIAMELHTIKEHSKNEIIERLQLIGYTINCKNTVGGEEILYAKRSYPPSSL